MKSNSAEDAFLLGQVAKGQSVGIEALYNRYSRLVFSIALTIIGDRSVAEEATLDVFVQVWRRANTYDPARGNVRLWLAAIARHHAIDILRWQSSRLDSKSLYLDDLQWLGDPSQPVVEEETELALQRKRVQDAVAQLPADQRQVLFLAYFKGLSHQQISDALEQPLGTVKTRIRLAMQKLRKLLLDELDEVESVDTSEKNKTT